MIDVHCHLDMLEKEMPLDEIIEKSKDITIVSNGVNPESNRKTLEYRKKGVKICLGIYPDHIMEMSDKQIIEEMEFIRKNRDGIWGIGEVGMDFVSGKNKKQEKYFREFIKLAMKLDKPITVHSRKAELECIEILEDLKAKKVIMHYFSGKKNLITRIVENGWMLSVPTAVKSSEHFQNLIKMTPIEQLLCETDSPYSHPDKKFPNHPGNVLESYKMIAKIKKMNLKDVEKQLEKNFEKLCGG